MESKAPADAPGTVTIYTDGACSGNPGPGGYGTVLLYAGRRQTHRKSCQSPRIQRCARLA